MGPMKKLERVGKTALVVAILAGIAGLVFSILWGWIGGINQIVDAFALEPDDNTSALWGLARTIFAGFFLTYISAKLIFSGLAGGVFLKFFKKASQPTTMNFGNTDPGDLFEQFFGKGR